MSLKSKFPTSCVCAYVTQLSASYEKRDFWVSHLHIDARCSHPSRKVGRFFLAFLLLFCSRRPQPDFFFLMMMQKLFDKVFAFDFKIFESKTMDTYQNLFLKSALFLGWS